MEDIFDQLIGKNEKLSDVEVSDENNEGGDIEEEKKRIVKPKHRIGGNTRVTLDVLKLTGDRGVGEIIDMAENVELKGEKHETEDLARILKLLHLWSCRLYPRMAFEDCLNKIEHLCRKRGAQTYLTKLRLGMIDEAKEANDSSTSKEESRESDEIKERIMKNRIIAQLRREKLLNSKQQSNDLIHTIQD